MKRVIRSKSFKEFIHYGLIGVANTTVTALLFALLYYCLKIQSISLALAVLTATVGSFYLNSRFNFKRSVSKYKFLLFMVMNLTIAWACGKFGDVLVLPPWLTFILETVVFYPLGFILNKFLVFSGEGAKQR